MIEFLTSILCDRWLADDHFSLTTLSWCLPSTGVRQLSLQVTDNLTTCISDGRRETIRHNVNHHRERMG